MSVIQADPVKLSQSWGAQFGDYIYNDKPMDFQDLMVEVAENRAVSVEGEVKPLSTRIQARNQTLEELGVALADLTSLQAQFDSDADGDDRAATLKQTSYDTLTSVFGDAVDFDDLRMTKYEVEYWLQMVKNKIDALNNEAEKDMTRLESLVDRRDEAYTTASDLMSEVSDTRSNVIGNM